MNFTSLHCAPFVAAATMGWWAPNASSAGASASSSPAWWWPFQTEQQRRHAQFCTTAFPGMWDAWVTSFTDFGFAGFATAPPPAPEEQQQPPPSVLPAAPRLVAIGDLHGDLRKAWRAFRLAGLVDDMGRWSGGSTVCVQVGRAAHGHWRMHPRPILLHYNCLYRAEQAPA